MEFTTTEKNKVGILPFISFMFRANIEFIRLGKGILDMWLLHLCTERYAAYIVEKLFNFSLF